MVDKWHPISEAVSDLLEKVEELLEEELGETLSGFVIRQTCGMVGKQITVTIKGEDQND